MKPKIASMAGHPVAPTIAEDALERVDCRTRMPSTRIHKAPAAPLLPREARPTQVHLQTQRGHHHTWSAASSVC